MSIKDYIQRLKNNTFDKDNDFPTIRVYAKFGEQLFRQVYDCAEAFQLSIDDIWLLVLNEKKINGFQFNPVNGLCNHSESEKKWTGENLYIPGKTRPLTEYRPVKLLNIKTGEMKQYTSTFVASRCLNTTTDRIIQHTWINPQDEVELFLKRFVILDNNISVKFVTPEVKNRLIKNVVKGYLVYFTETQTVKTFLTLPHLLKMFSGLTRQYLCHQLTIKEIYPITSSVFITKVTPELYLMTDNKLREWFDHKVTKLS